MPLYLQFYVWLFGISAVVFGLERAFSPSPKHEIIRDGFVQDLFWMIFNVQYVSWMLAILTVHTVAWFNSAFFHFGLATPDTYHLISTWPRAAQFVVFFVLKDFLEWNIHRTLHRVPWLWNVHKLHHSSVRLDWLATFRSHWTEMLIYKILIYLPLVVLGVDDKVIFAILVMSLLIQEIAHANLSWDWGPLRYVINSPRLHAWHHSIEMHGVGGQNFSINLSVWDWLFGTVYWPRNGESPAQLGFEGLNEYPSTVWGRFWNPFAPRRRIAGTEEANSAASANADTKKLPDR